MDVEVPTDLSIAGFDDIAFAAYAAPALVERQSTSAPRTGTLRR